MSSKATLIIEYNKPPLFHKRGSEKKSCFCSILKITENEWQSKAECNSKRSKTRSVKKKNWPRLCYHGQSTCSGASGDHRDSEATDWGFCMAKFYLMKPTPVVSSTSKYCLACSTLFYSIYPSMGHVHRPRLFLETKQSHKWKGKTPCEEFTLF